MNEGSFRLYTVTHGVFFHGGGYQSFKPRHFDKCKFYRSYEQAMKTVRQINKYRREHGHDELNLGISEYKCGRVTND